MDFKHILSTQQFLNKKVLVDIFRKADKFERADRQGKIPKLLQNKILSCVFYEPSTRTRFSFESAVLKLGGQVITTESAGHFSSAIKGETLEDSVRIISVLRYNCPAPQRTRSRRTGCKSFSRSNYQCRRWRWRTSYSSTP